MATPALPLTPALTARIEGIPLVLLLDIDGTLSPIAPRPEVATIPAETREVLQALSALPRVNVVFVTGRGAADGRRLVGFEGGWVIGNHGMELARPHESVKPRDDVAPFAPSIATAANRISSMVGDRAWHGVIVEDKQLTLSVHYRLASPRILPALTEEVTRIAEDVGLRVTSGKQVLELRPPIDVNKGTAALELVQALGALQEQASVIAAGDDRTDEDLFRVLRAHHSRAVTVRVGASVETDAEFVVDDTVSMRNFLAAVLDIRRQSRTPSLDAPSTSDVRRSVR